MDSIHSVRAVAEEAVDMRPSGAEGLVVDWMDIAQGLALPCALRRVEGFGVNF